MVEDDHPHLRVMAVRDAAGGQGSRRHRRMPALFAALLLAGCAVFAPRYDATLDGQATTGYFGVQRLLAGIELGEFADPASFVEARPRYVELIATLAVAEQRARSLPVSGGGTAKRAQADLAGLFADCRAQIVSLAKIHRRVGLTPALGVEAPVNTSCDAAARARARAAIGGAGMSQEAMDDAVEALFQQMIGGAAIAGKALSEDSAAILGYMRDLAEDAVQTRVTILAGGMDAETAAEVLAMHRRARHSLELYAELSAMQSAQAILDMATGLAVGMIRAETGLDMAVLVAR